MLSDQKIYEYLRIGGEEEGEREEENEKEVGAVRKLSKQDEGLWRRVNLRGRKSIYVKKYKSVRKKENRSIENAIDPIPEEIMSIPDTSSSYPVVSSVRYSSYGTNSSYMPR